MSITSDYSTKVDWNRRLMMEPDIWPEGVKITSGFVREVTGYAVTNVNNGMATSTWGIYQVPLKGANMAIAVTSRNEYMFYANEDLTVFKQYGANLLGQVIPTWAKYFIHSSRSASAKLTSLTFYYLSAPPEKWVSSQRYIVTLDKTGSSSTYRTMSRFAPCHGATKLVRSSGSRGACFWYDVNKQRISGTAYSTSTSWEVPKEAYYFRIERATSGTVTSGHWVDRDIVTLSL